MVIMEKTDDNKGTFLFIKDVAWGLKEIDEIEDWLRRNTRISNP